MATYATKAPSLWLPGFCPTEEASFPDLFSEPPSPAAPPPSNMLEGEQIKAWRPSLCGGTTRPAAAFDWPAWDVGMRSDAEGTTFFVVLPLSGPAASPISASGKGG